MSVKIEDSELIENLKSLAQKLGRTPKKEEFKLGKYSHNSYRRAFGNLTNAFIMAGLKPTQNRTLSDQKLLNDIKRVAKQLNKAPEVKEFQKLTDTVSWKSIVNRFGTWNKALKLAGLPINKVQKVSKQEVKEALQTWYNKHNQDVRCFEYWKIRKARGRNKFPYSTNTVLKKSGKKSWESAMKEYGFEEYETVDQFIKRGFFQGYDGNTYLSSIEKQVGDCLYMLKRQNKIEGYEYEFLVCDDEKWTCDFKVILNSGDDLWLEIDGMVGNRSVPYQSGENKKIEYYKQNSFNFYILTYRDKNICAKIKSLI